MTTYKTTITSIAVHVEGQSPIFGEYTTQVRLDDDAAGVYLVLDQSGQDGAESGIVKLNPDELPVIMEVARRLLDQGTVKDSTKEG